MVRARLPARSRVSIGAFRVEGTVLTALHEQPAHAWTLEELARVAGASRSVFAERFQQLVGSSPMHYLAHWRMLLAANLLCRSSVSLAHVAEQVGYQTDTAFSRAFRREFGVPPAAWRRRHVEADGPSGPAVGVASSVRD